MESARGFYTFHMDVSQDGNEWQTFMEGRYARQPEAKSVTG